MSHKSKQAILALLGVDDLHAFKQSGPNAAYFPANNLGEVLEMLELICPDAIVVEANAMEALSQIELSLRKAVTVYFYRDGGSLATLTLAPKHPSVIARQAIAVAAGASQQQIVGYSFNRAFPGASSSSAHVWLPCPECCS